MFLNDTEALEGKGLANDGKTFHYLASLLYVLLLLSNGSDRGRRLSYLLSVSCDKRFGIGYSQIRKELAGELRQDREREGRYKGGSLRPP
jgi:hypothetical protein